MKLTREEVRQAVAALLHVPPSELKDKDNLFDWGLDSIRLLTLLEDWRTRGANISFAQLAETPTLESWYPHLTEQRVPNAA